MKLPLFINRENWFIAGALMYGIGYICYYVTNHNTLFEPVTLPHTWIDRNAPFVPETILIYMSEYFYFVFVYLTLRNYRNINQYLYSFFSLQVFSCLIFVIYPTIYPRDAFPVDQVEPEWLKNTWIWLRNQDAPTNCLPSLHVSSVYLSAFVYRTDGTATSQKPRMLAFWIFFIWGTFIALSTLTTKQHYLADIVSGLGLAWIFYWWFHHRQQYFEAHSFIKV